MHNDEYWAYSVQDDLYSIGLFTSLDCVLKMTKQKERFNFLAVVKEPMEGSRGIRIDGFDFVGYELLDKFYSCSALTNLGCIDKGFSPDELNQFGLIDSFDEAYSVKAHLREKNPDVEEAETYVIALWRH